MRSPYRFIVWSRTGQEKLRGEEHRLSVVRRLIDEHVTGRGDSALEIIESNGNRTYHSWDSSGGAVNVVTIGEISQPASIAPVLPTRLTARGDPAAWFNWIPSRILPGRVRDEVVGDAIERLSLLQVDGGPHWRLRLLWAYLVLVIVCETIRYAVRSIKGEKAR